MCPGGGDVRVGDPTGVNLVRGDGSVEGVVPGGCVLHREHDTTGGSGSGTASGVASGVSVPVAWFAIPNDLGGAESEAGQP